jgi:hypothetical protein
MLLPIEVDMHSSCRRTAGNNNNNSNNIHHRHGHRPNHQPSSPHLVTHANMKTSTALQAFKSLASRIHPQLPLSEPESQRLLNALTSSFRNHLDHHQRDSSASLSAAASPLPPHPSSSSQATHLHLASILTNPLLTKPVHRQLKTSSKHPIALFEDQVAAGRQTLHSARLCLEAFRTSLQDCSAAQISAQISRYAAGTRALRWLWTSAATPSLEFALDSRFCNQLSFFLIHEGRETALWELIDTPVPASANLSTREAGKRKGLLLASMVKTHMSIPTNSLQSALDTFFRALDTSNSSHAAMSYAGLYLTQALLKLTISSPTNVALYDRFVNAVPRWNKRRPDRALFRIANLTLHHPTTPSADPALDFVRHVKPLASHPFLEPSTSSQESAVFAFLFDSVKLLQKQSRFDDALWIMEFMQQKFPKEFTSTSRLSTAPSSPSAPRSDHGSTHSSFPDWKVPEFG